MKDISKQKKTVTVAVVKNSSLSGVWLSCLLRNHMVSRHPALLHGSIQKEFNRWKLCENL